MNQLQLFKYQDKEVRTVTLNGEPWFVAKDVCEVLGLGNSREAVGKLDEEEKGAEKIDTLGGPQQMAVVNESGLYTLIIRSNMPNAKPFRKWVTTEVIPSIRKHGAYMTPETIEKVLLNPDTIIDLATRLKTEMEQRKLLEAKVEADKPLVVFANSVETSDDTCLVGDLAKLIRQNGTEIGQQRLFDWMRNNGFLIKFGASKNMPTQRAMELGLFEVKERTIDNPDGSIRVTRTTKVTGKGQIYFINKFLGKE
jgi:anti-repressor protein